MNDDALEIAILRSYIEAYEVAEVGSPGNKCARELDMREVLKKLQAVPPERVIPAAERWLTRLAPPRQGNRAGPLKRCSMVGILDGPHRFNARAFVDPGYRPSAPAWERLRELEQVVKPAAKPSTGPELEQKFGIVRSWPQAGRDFAAWVESGIANGSVLFIDIDFFKRLNTRHTNELVDRDLLLPFQQVLLSLCRGQGEVYRHGGDEFVVLLPNKSSAEARTLAEGLRSMLLTTDFSVGGVRERVTVSVGIARWPEHGRELSEVTVAASRTQVHAKEAGRDKVFVSGEWNGAEDAVQVARRAQETLKAQGDRRQLLDQDGPRAAIQESQILFSEVRRLAAEIARASPTLQLRGEHEDHRCRLTTGEASAELHSHFTHPADQSMIIMTKWRGRLQLQRTLPPRKEPEEVGKIRFNFDHHLEHGWCWRTRVKPHRFFTSRDLADHLMKHFVAFAQRMASEERA